VKLINNRLYLDYNATAPLAESVTDWFSKGALPFANPSSIHTSGKLSKKLITKTKDYLAEAFGLNDFEVFFHSGATEGINDIAKGFAFHNKMNGDSFHFLCLKTDHSCVVNQKDHIEALGGHFHAFDVDANGSPDIEAIIAHIRTLSGNVLLNFTYVHNETGVVLPLQLAKQVKEETGCLVHVDAVQLVGKVLNDIKLCETLDFYTFSGHKFGAMKGVGFTFAKSCMENWSALIRGGGQQSAMRSGTENIHGIYSLRLALETFFHKQQTQLVFNEKKLFEEKLLENYGDKISIVGKDAPLRNTNTTYFVINDDVKIDVLLTALDLAQIDVSSGSACSSGIVRPSRVLLAMGYSEQQAKSAIRVSFSYQMELGDHLDVYEKLSKVLSRFIKG
jgi:cysteine desulfurase